MNTRSIPFLFLALLAFLVPVPGSAAPDPDKRTEAALAKHASGTRRAVIGLNVEHAPNRNQPFLGVFISDDGLALVNLASLARKQKPTVWIDGGKQLGLGSILKILPDLEMALVKFDHRPKVWLKVAEKEPEIGESVALVPLDRQDVWEGELPPVIGPILAKRSGMSSNLRESRFTRLLSLGAGLTSEQRGALTPGCFAINARGELAAFMAGTQRNRSQTLVLLAPVGELPEWKGQAGDINEAIPFPLPDEENLIDLALLDDDFRGMDLAIHNRNPLQARHHLNALLQRHPQSQKLKILAASEPILLDPAKPLVGLANLSPAAGAGKADQVELLGARATIHLIAEDMQGAIRELEAAIRPGLAPVDYPKHRNMLADLYLADDQLEKAAALYREIYRFSPDSIDVVANYELALIKLGRSDEAERLGLAKRDTELGRIYRRR